jgi:hypothetical protein
VLSDLLYLRIAEGSQDLHDDVDSQVVLSEAKWVTQVSISHLGSPRF